MSEVVVLTATGDESLKSSRWAGQQVSERLAAVSFEITPIEQRGGLRAALDQLGGAAGVAFFCHGSEHALIDGEKSPILDADNADRLRGRWAYAFACRSGVELAAIAAHHGCDAYVGYEAAVIVEWSPDDIPDVVRSEFAELLSEAALLLATGERDQRALRTKLLAKAGPLQLWCIDHPGASRGLEITLQQLCRRVVLRCRAATDTADPATDN